MALTPVRPLCLVVEDAGEVADECHGGGEWGIWVDSDGIAYTVPAGTLHFFEHEEREEAIP